MGEKRIYQVLIVDDEPYVLQTIAMLLEDNVSHELEIFQAGSAMAALSIMHRRRIDVLITDVQMPNIDGLQLAHIVHQRWLDCKTIILTAYADFSYVRSALREDVSGYVLKSESDNALIEEFSRAIRALDLQMESLEHLMSVQSMSDQRIKFFIQETMKNLIHGTYAHDMHTYTEALKALDCPNPSEPVSLFCLLAAKCDLNETACEQLQHISKHYLNSISSFLSFARIDGKFWGILQLQDDLEVNSLQDMLSNVVERFSEFSQMTTVCLFSHSVSDAESFSTYCSRMVKYNANNADSPYVHVMNLEVSTPYANSILAIVTEYIETNLFGDVCLETLAKVAGYNASYLSRLFLKHVGMNLSNYIADRKMKALMELLKNTEYSLDQIIEISGFESKATFNRFVKRMTGFSPKHLREKTCNTDSPI